MWCDEVGEYKPVLYSNRSVHSSRLVMCFFLFECEVDIQRQKQPRT